MLPLSLVNEELDPAEAIGEDEEFCASPLTGVGFKQVIHASVMALSKLQSGP
jgi:hypothetical protein